VSFCPIAGGKSNQSGASRRHVGGASSAAVKPWKCSGAGASPLHTMYVALRSETIHYSDFKGDATARSNPRSNQNDHSVTRFSSFNVNLGWW
jgi:hypothetical protein